MVGGMPLGIELAAAWVSTFSCEEIAQKIEENLTFLTSEPPAMREEQRSMLAVINSFWESLLRYRTKYCLQTIRIQNALQ